MPPAIEEFFAVKYLLKAAMFLTQTTGELCAKARRFSRAQLRFRSALVPFRSTKLT